MAFDKKQLYSNVKLTWPNAEERDYLLGLLKKDGVTCGYADNTPLSGKAPESSPEKTASSAGDPNANKPVTTSEAGSPGVITEEEAQKIKNASLNLAKTVNEAQKK